MLSKPTATPRRHGVAAVEMAVVSMPLVVTLLGVWEVGRMIHVTQIIANAAREGSRLAAQGQIIHPDPGGGFSYHQVHRYGSAPSVASTVRAYLADAGINTTGVPDSYLVQYVNNSQPNPPPPVPPPSPPRDPNEPWGATKNDRLSVTVTVPWDRVRWAPVTLLNPTSLQVTVDAFCLQDDYFVVQTTMPQW